MMGQFRINSLEAHAADNEHGLELALAACYRLARHRARIAKNQRTAERDELRNPDRSAATNADLDNRRQDHPTLGDSITQVDGDG